MLTVVIYVILQSNEPPIDAKDLDFHLEDFETVKVIGKGSGGVVQLVRHKWTGAFFALKVIIFRILLSHRVPSCEI